MKYYEEGAIPLTFAQMREAYLKFGLVVDEMPITYSSAAVKIVHDGVPYKLDCYHDIDDISTTVSKFYIILERHHTDIKRVFEIWRPLISKDMVVMAGGGLQLQAFFSTKGCYEGILGLSHIDDGRFAAIEAALSDMGVPVCKYQPDPRTFKGPHTMVVKPHWFETLPDIENIRLQCESTHKKRNPASFTS